MPSDVKRTLKIKTTQKVDPNKPQVQAGFPMRNWSIELFLVNEHDGSHAPASAYEKVTYHLHPSFEDRQKQTFRQAPFRCSESGWGEFEMRIVLTPIGAKTQGEHTVTHDLNFQEEEYEATHKVAFKSPKENLLEQLRASGPVPGDNASASKPSTSTAATQKKSRAKTNNVDMDKLAEGLQKLDEDSLLHVVQLVHEQKSSETYTKNDVENGEFHVDLYTLPDALVKGLWDYVGEKVGVA